MKRPYNLSDWEVLVVRAALAKHAAKCPTSHQAAIPRIQEELRKHDNPFGVLKKAK